MESGNNDNDVQEVSPQAMAFTVTFDTGRTTTKNQFVKRHSRNLSLPISKVYDNKTGTEPHVNGKGPKNIGNHSEGYFSSDPEEDPANNGKNFPKTKSFNGEIGWSDGRGEEGEEESDCGSETGTYTVEKESSEVITARLSIDANFGLQTGGTSSLQTSRDSPHWIDDWASQAAAPVNQSSTPTAAAAAGGASSTNSVSEEWTPSPAVRSLSMSRPASTITRPAPTPRPLNMTMEKYVLGASKIPSPVVTRARLGSRGALATPPARSKTEETNSPLAVPKFHPNSRQEPLVLFQEERRDTERYLKATEKVVEAMAARLSFDSESEPEAGGSASPNQPNINRYNRAFSLRRGRLDENGTTPKKSETKTEDPVFKKPLTPKQKTPTTPILSRTDTGRTSMRISRHPPSPQLSTPKVVGVGTSTVVTVKKKPSGGRSNSTLSSKEVEFQNWKRRKSYDPMKAAAEGKKSNSKTKQTTSNSGGPPVGTTSVLRSASFHGTRQLSNPQQSSSDDDENVNVSNDEDDWPTLPAPKTSRETTPLGSRMSLYSNSSNSPRTQRHKLEGVDNLVVSAIASLSSKLRLSGSSLLRKLRCLYDDENDKSKVLETEIEQLENTDVASPQPRSPSKELASTLRNLKRIDSMIRVLDEVLFDDTDYE